MTDTILYTFIASTDGSEVATPLIAIGSTLYGCTWAGGTNSNGTIFSITTGGTFTNLHNFTTANGTFVNGVITDGSKLYGTAYGGGANGKGSVFSCNLDGSSFTVLYSFTGSTDGENPDSNLLLIGSTLYGTCSGGGANGNGNIFSISVTGGSPAILYSFGTGTDGQIPEASLISDGTNLYGVCSGGGTSGFGTVFSIGIGGSGYSTLYSFSGNPSDGSIPEAELLLIGSTLYGTCSAGGTNNNGTIFSISTTGVGYTSLYSFGTLPDGASPFSSLIEVSGVLYGTCYTGGADSANGTIFSINPNGTGYTTLYSFQGSPDGKSPNAGVVLIGSNIYGSCYTGGSETTPAGVIYSFPVSSSTDATATPGVLSITSALHSPSFRYDYIKSVSSLALSTILSTATGQVNLQSFSATPFSLGITLLNPSLNYDFIKTVTPLSLSATLQPVREPGLDTANNILKIVSYNPLIAICNTSPVSLAIINITSFTEPTWDVYYFSGVENPKDMKVDGLGNVYIACADGNILTFNIVTPLSYSVISTGASGNLNSLALLETNDGATSNVFMGTDWNYGETLDMYEGSATTIACDVRFSASYQSILGTQINTINAQTVSTDIRFSGIVNNIVGCDIRFISTSYVDLSITPIARTDFIVYIGGIECPDVKLDSIEITHTADDKSQATFTLSRKHDNVNYVLNPDNTQGTYIPVLGHPTVQITIQGNPEFGYDTPAYIWDVDCKSENEQVKIVAYSELPKQDERSNVTLSIPLVNEKLHVYHALVNNPVIDNPVILADDINPPFYLGILIDNGYTRIQNITQYQGFSSISQTEDQFVNYIFGSGDSGITDINGNDIYFKPLQNWTYFWFGHATNFITGQTWEGLLSNGSSYLGTSPSSLTTTTWNVDYINFWYQREFPNSVYRGSPQNVGSAIVYPSDFLGIVPFPYNPDPYDNIVNINPFNGHTTIDQVLRDHTPMTFTGADILNAKTRLAVFVSPGSTLTTINGINYLITLEGDLTPVQLNMSTKILDLIDSKFGITFGDAPYKKVSAKSGILTTVTKWEDAPNGLFYHKQQGYNYVNYTNSVGEIEFEKIQNINGSVLPKTKCDIEQFIDGYYYYNIQLLKRINIDQTTQPNIYDGNNGFPVSVKSIHISSKDMKVTLDCTNAWSRLELLELEGQIPDPYYSLIPEVITEYSPKFDPNSLTNTT